MFANSFKNIFPTLKNVTRAKIISKRQSHSRIWSMYKVLRDAYSSCDGDVSNDFTEGGGGNQSNILTLRIYPDVIRDS